MDRWHRIREGVALGRSRSLLGREATASTLLGSHNETLFDQRPNVLTTVEPELSRARIGFAMRSSGTRLAAPANRRSLLARDSSPWRVTIWLRLHATEAVDSIRD